jgi:squalene-hopene/tetraprenyl-beta-curcumene cyclase
MIDLERLVRAHDAARRDLLAWRNARGHWVGRLSGSALSTATATSALALVDRHTSPRSNHAPLIARAVDWLMRHQNDDGGWGDTDRSRSNVATTMLVRSAMHLAGVAGEHAGPLGRAEVYLDAQGGIPGLRQRYGRDKTFAVPILTNCALAGLVPWDEVSPLPFELACFPHPVLRFLRLPVVSYAVPALVAMGQALYFHRPPRNPVTRLVRRIAVERSLAVLGRMQPDSGGYLEATPLTSFVVMSLASIGRADHLVVRRGVEFLVASAGEDGCWPIDTNLATWNTTLAIGALAGGEREGCGLGDVEPLVEWLLACQHRRVHPFTNAAPGGWGWTDLSGAVPDVDDTAGALLALRILHQRTHEVDDGRRREIHSAVEAGVRWLLDVENADGGWPTFCRGWGVLPFDRSAPDLTAHAIRALGAWRATLPEAIDAAVARGFVYLAGRQRPDGSWVPLWFGNEHDPAEENPVYGTARVLAAYAALGRSGDAAARRGLDWLCCHRNADGGWGGDLDQVSGVEETALATEALLGAADDRSLEVAIAEGLNWLVEAVASGRHRQCEPIGFYFARLWYYEAMYPLIFTVSALARAVDWLSLHATAHRDSTRSVR